MLLEIPLALLRLLFIPLDRFWIDFGSILDPRWRLVLLEAGKGRQHLARLGPSSRGFDICSPTKPDVIHSSPSRRFPNLEKQSRRIPWTPHIPQASERSLNRSSPSQSPPSARRGPNPTGSCPQPSICRSPTGFFPAFLVPGEGKP